MTARYARLTFPLLTAIVLAACSAAGGSAPPSSGASAGPTAVQTATSSSPVLPISTAEDAMAAVVAAHPDFAGFRPHDPSLIGQSKWWDARPASGVGAFVVTVSVGWGDCPAGCIDTHTWTYAVTPDGTVRLLSEAGPTVPPDVIAPTGSSGGGHSGIAGHATAGPVCPVETNPPDPACAPRPVGGATIHVVDTTGNEAATATTDDLGGYSVEIAPGDYQVTVDAVPGFMGTPRPVPTVVLTGSMATVDLSFDTGIR